MQTAVNCEFYQYLVIQCTVRTVRPSTGGGPHPDARGGRRARLELRRHVAVRAAVALHGRRPPALRDGWLGDARGAAPRVAADLVRLVADHARHEVHVGLREGGAGAVLARPVECLQGCGVLGCCRRRGRRPRGALDREGEALGRALAEQGQCVLHEHQRSGDAHSQRWRDHHLQRGESDHRHFVG